MTEDVISFTGSTDAPFHIIIAGISYCDGTYHIHREVSDLYCLEYVRKGQGTVSTDGQTFHPAAGDVYILHAGKMHDYFSDANDPWEKIWFNCTGSLVSALLRVYGLENTYYFPQLDLHAEFDEFLENARQNPQTAHENNVFLLHRILQLAARSRTAPSTDAARLKSYLDAHAEEAVSIDTLSRLIFRSPSQTIRIFKSAYGITPYQYNLNARLEAARLLLKNSLLPVHRIALQLHFSDEHYFSGLFKKKNGVSPLAYRNKKIF